MASIKFYLKDSSKSETAIFARISYGAKIINNGKNEYIQLKYFISQSINPAHWNPKTNRAKATKEFPQHPEFNSRLNVIESTINSIFLKFENSNIQPTNELIKKELDKIIKPGNIQGTKGAKEVKHMTLFEFIDFLIQTSTNKESTLKSYKVTRKNLQDYQQAKKTVLNFNSIDIDFYNSFVDYLKKQHLAKNTIGTRIKILKTFMSEANERGVLVPDDYKKRSFAKPKEETLSVYLNESELKQMMDIEISTESLNIMKEKFHYDKFPDYLIRVRDLFIVGCYTGLRFSDFSQLKKENINSDNTISTKTQKTGKNVVIPVHPIILQILEKYDYNLPRAISNQKFNNYLKEVAQIAGISEPITTEITKGSMIVSKTTEKYNLITSHTARRSFATNAYLADVPSISIMQITGHKTESAFMKYIKMSAKDNAVKMKSHKFFNPLLIAK